MPYSHEETAVLSAVSVAMSAISLASCLFIILCWCLFKDLRKLAYGFVFYMAIATLLRTFAKTWGGHFQKGDTICSVQGFLMIYGGLSTFYWIMTIALVMYTMIFHPFMWYQEGTIATCNKIALIVNFTVPFFFALLPALTDNYAPTGGWCWIEGTSGGGKALRWVSFYGQLVVILGFCIFAYVRIYVYLRWSKSAEGLHATHKMYSRIKWYPLCLLLGYTVATLRRFIELWDHKLGFGWAMATSVTTGLFGFFLLLVYGRLGRLNTMFKQRFVHCIPFCDAVCCCLEEKVDATPQRSQSQGSLQNSKQQQQKKGQKPSSIQAPNGGDGDKRRVSTMSRASTTAKVIHENLNLPPSPSPSPQPDRPAPIHACTADRASVISIGMVSSFSPRSMPTTPPPTTPPAPAVAVQTSTPTSPMSTRSRPSVPQRAPPRRPGLPHRPSLTKPSSTSRTSRSHQDVLREAFEQRIRANKMDADRVNKV
eukprot:CAMPEP_0202707754 /NCGR_PEP_ID=MMETSP1385-20130828/20043_1 /ASSEMBLY_ACC=CAM_ASM_000861 /TAXON_ID=933848 /ORGANISM="Elphidium margaritaceum" /LENGTH=480 /DNA_ID=CAMNT_0049366539 /DNA_START=58 /DNA_END=1500 /DNA_ORIENTATION=+